MEPIYYLLQESRDQKCRPDMLNLRQASDAGDVSLLASDEMTTTLLRLSLAEVQKLSAALAKYCTGFEQTLEWWEQDGELREFATWCDDEMGFTAMAIISVMSEPERWTREYDIYRAWVQADADGNERLKELLLDAWHSSDDRTAADVLNEWAG